MIYTAELDDDGSYHITKQPRGEGVWIGGQLMQTEFKDGLPLPCVNHFPYVETCSQRFALVRNIVEGAGLPANYS